MILTNSGVLKLMQRIKSYIASQLNTKAPSVHTHTISEIDNLASQLGGGYSKSEIDTLLNGKTDTSHTHSKSQITDFPSYGTTANTICEGNDSRLSDARTPTSHTHTKSEITDFPTIPTVNNATLTIQKNGTNVKTFTANASSDVTCNITVPTKVSELTNDSGFLTSSGSCNYANSAGSASSATTAGAVSTSVSIGSTKDLVYAGMADNDAFRIRCGGDSDDGYVEIATSDNGNEPIYIRQYSWNNTGPGAFDQIVRTLTLLDGSGNTQFPGTVTASTFTGNLTGNCSGSAGSVAWNNVSGKPTIPTNTSQLTNDSGFLTSHQDLSGYVPRSGGAVLGGTEFRRTTNNEWLSLHSSSDGNGSYISLESGGSPEAGVFAIHARTTPSDDKILRGSHTGTLTWGAKNVAMAEDVIPRSGGAVITGDFLGRTSADQLLMIGGGDERKHGGNVIVCGTSMGYDMAGAVCIIPNIGDGSEKYMWIKPDGTWTWTGQAVQLVSDQRLKQQITEIDDKLLDAWEDVDLVQFKYNDAVDTKGDKARLHTGFVVQQIDDACKKHGVDISAYGLYCHEEYPQEVEEVEVEQADGTKAKEKKVIREASEHYSLRYTEALIVECKYLRREVSRLKQQNENFEQRLKMVEQSVK